MFLGKQMVKNDEESVKSDILKSKLGFIVMKCFCCVLLVSAMLK